MRGIEPRAFHMQSERSTTELHPLLYNATEIIMGMSKIVLPTGGLEPPNLRFRRPTPYPLGHAGEDEKYVKTSNNTSSTKLTYRECCISRVIEILFMTPLCVTDILIETAWPNG